MSVEDTIKGVFTKSWDVFSNNFVVLILGNLLAFVLMIFIVTIPPLAYGIYYLTSQCVKGKEAKVSDIFKGFSFFFRSWGLVLLWALGLVIGFILLIVPGLFLLVVWQFAFAVMVLESRGITDSLGRSYALARENFGFSVVLLILVCIIGAIGSYTKVGWLLTSPFTTVVTVVAAMALAGTGAKSPPRKVSSKKTSKKKKKR